MKKINLRKNCLLQNIFISLDNKQIKRGEYYSSLFYCQIAKLSFVLAKSDDLDVMDKNKVLKVILIWLQCFYLKTEVQWRELPIESYFEKGEISWQNVYYYFNKWSKDGSFQRV